MKTCSIRVSDEHVRDFTRKDVPRNEDVTLVVKQPVLDERLVPSDQMLHVCLVFLISRSCSFDSQTQCAVLFPFGGIKVVCSGGPTPKVKYSPCHPLSAAISLQDCDSRLAAPCLRRSSMRARMGATPVPGPTKMSGTDGSGRCSVGGLILMGTLVPVWIIRAGIVQPTLGGLTDGKIFEPIRAESSSWDLHIRLVLHESYEQLHFSWMSLIWVSLKISQGWTFARPTEDEEAMENCRRRKGGKTSRMYDIGIFVCLKSAKVSSIVRDGRVA